MPKPNLAGEFDFFRCTAAATHSINIAEPLPTPNSEPNLPSWIAFGKRRRGKMEEPGTSSKTRGANYRTHEDRVLCSAWLTVSCDPVVGVYQTGDAFYLKVKEEFDAELERQNLRVGERSSISLGSRFITIYNAASKFEGCHEKVEKLCASGRSPTDIEHDAIALYESIPKNGTFKFLQCWNILRHSPKWGAWRLANMKRKTPAKRLFSDAITDEATDDSTTQDEQHNTELPAAIEAESLRGASKAKLDRANLTLYARQVKAAERAVTNSEMRVTVAREQLEISLFSIQPSATDDLANEYLALKRRAIVNRLRAEEAASIEAAASQATQQATSETQDAALQEGELSPNELVI